MKIIKCSSQTEFLQLNARALEYFYKLGNTAAKWADPLFDDKGVIYFTVEDAIRATLTAAETNRIEEIDLVALTLIDPANPRRLAENYIGKFFTLGERDHLLVLLLHGNPKAADLYVWISLVIAKGIAGENDFDTLGNPPLSYMEIVSV